MYNIHYETDKGNVPVISIEGSLDTVDDIARVVSEVHSIVKNNNGTMENGGGVIINLSKAKVVSDECLKMFKRFQPVYGLEFKGYSLYIELQLKEYDLITKTGTEDEKV